MKWEGGVVRAKWGRGIFLEIGKCDNKTLLLPCEEENQPEIV
jgi:hypothetical protein